MLRPFVLGLAWHLSACVSSGPPLNKQCGSLCVGMARGTLAVRLAVWPLGEKQRDTGAVLAGSWLRGQGDLVALGR